MKRIAKKISLAIGQFLLRYGLGIILIWLGVMKFRNSEAVHLREAMADTFILKWTLKYITIYSLSQLIAWIQIISGVLVMLKPVSKRTSAWGGVLAMVIFLTSILIFITSEIVWQTGYGFPELSRTGHSLLKDFVLFGAAAWCWSDSL